MRNPISSHQSLALLAASLLTACLVAAGTAGAGRSRDTGPRARPPAAPACAEPARNADACLVVLHFFDHVDHGRFEAACDLLGARLRYDTGGSSCATAMPWAYFVGTRSWAILGTRLNEVDVGVLVRLRLPELGHTRRVTWLARVARDPGSQGLRIVSTNLVG